jgi:hypothetical protein
MKKRIFTNLILVFAFFVGFAIPIYATTVSVGGGTWTYSGGTALKAPTNNFFETYSRSSYTRATYCHGAKAIVGTSTVDTFTFPGVAAIATSTITSVNALSYTYTWYNSSMTNGC